MKIWKIFQLLKQIEMITLKQDITKIKKLLLDKKIAEIRSLDGIFTPSYRLKIISNLNPIERHEWSKINNYDFELLD